MSPIKNLNRIALLIDSCKTLKELDEIELELDQDYSKAVAKQREKIEADIKWHKEVDAFIARVEELVRQLPDEELKQELLRNAGTASIIADVHSAWHQAKYYLSDKDSNADFRAWNSRRLDLLAPIVGIKLEDFSHE